MLFSYRFYTNSEMDITVGIVRAADKSEAENKIKTKYKLIERYIDKHSIEINAVDFENDIIETYYGKYDV